MALTSEYYYNNHSEFTVTSANSFITVGTVADDGSQYWEIDFIFKGFVNGQIYRLDLDYVKTNDSYIEIDVLQNSTGGHESIVLDDVTDNEGHVTMTFKAEEHNCHNGEIVFGIGSYLSNTVTVTNVTFTEGRWLDYAIDYNNNANVSQLSPHEFLVTASPDWEIDLLLTNLTADKTYYLTYYYEHTGDGNLYHKVTEATAPYTTLAGGTDYTNEFKNKKGNKTIEFVPTTTTAYFCLYGNGGDFTQEIMVQKFKVSTEPPVFQKTKERVMSINGNKVYLDENYEHYLGGLGIKKVVTDKYFKKDIQLDNEGTLHCAYVTDYNDLVMLPKEEPDLDITGYTSNWTYNSTCEITSNQIKFNVTSNEGASWQYELVPNNLEIGSWYRIEYDYTNTTGNYFQFGWYDDVDTNGTREEYWLNRHDSTSGHSFIVFKCYTKTPEFAHFVAMNWEGQALNGTVTLDNVKLYKVPKISGTSFFTDHWHYNTSAFDFIDEGSIDYTILGNNWDNEFNLPVKAGKKYRFEFDLYNGTGKPITSTLRGKNSNTVSERYSDLYFGCNHIVHEFLSDGGNYWLLHDWEGEDYTLDASKFVMVRNLKLVELADDYNLGILNHYWQGGTDTSADWYHNENASGVTVLGKDGSYFATGVDFYSQFGILEPNTRKMCSFDFELSDAFAHQKYAWASCYLSFWSSDISNSIGLSDWQQLTDGNGRLKGHIESPNFITPTDNGNYYINVEAGETRYSNSWVKLTNFKVFTKLYNNRSMGLWWRSNGVEVDLSEPDTYIMTRNPEVLTTNHGEIAHQLYGFEEGTQYTFEADLEFIAPVEPARYLYNTFRIVDGHSGGTTIAEESFEIRSGEPLIFTKHLTYNFTGTSDAIGIYCSTWHENADIDKGFTFKLTNVVINKVQ